MDMALMFVTASARGLRDWGQTQADIALLQDLGLPIWSPAFSGRLFGNALREIVRDRGAQHLGVPTPEGIVWLEDVTVRELESAANDLAAMQLPT
jgi:hypothetical protein